MTEPRGKEGVNLVLEALFSYGSASLDHQAFQKALDDIGAVESAGSNFSLQVLSDHFDAGVRLLADNVLHPALPAEGFRIVRQQVAAMVAGRLKSPDYLTGRALKQALFPQNDPTLRQATRDSVMALREIPLSESSLESIARGLISRTELDLPIQEPSLAAQHYLALTADQVRAAFARRLRPSDLVRVAEGPQPK